MLMWLNRLLNHEYVEISQSNGKIASQELGPELVEDSDRIRYFNPITSEWMPGVFRPGMDRRELER